MSIQEFRSQLASEGEKAPLLLALCRLSRLDDLKGLALAVTSGGWGDWPVAVVPCAAAAAA